MRSLTLLCLLGLAVIVAGTSNSGNSELLQAINAALYNWQQGGADSLAAQSWATWYGYDYTNPNCPQASYPANPTAGGTLAEIISSKSLKIGSDYPSPPLYYPDADGTPQGFDVDFANYFVSQLNQQYNTSGITSTRVVDTFANLLTDLDNSSYPFDVASGGIFVTSARAQTVNFACNISVGALSGLVLSTSSIASISDVTSGVTVGVLAGSEQESVAQSQGATIYPVSLSTPDAAYPFLANGSIQVWLGSQTTTAYYIKSSSNAGSLTQLPQFGTVQGVAWATRPDTTTSSSSDALSVVASVASVVAGAAALLM